MLLRYKCHFCQTTKPGLRRCGQCLVAIYCDKHCQSASWPAHKQHCRIQLLILTRSLVFHPAPATAFKAIQKLARIHMDVLAELLLPTLCAEHIPNAKDRCRLGQDLIKFQKSIEPNIDNLYTFAVKLDVIVGDNQKLSITGDCFRICPYHSYARFPALQLLPRSGTRSIGEGHALLQCSTLNLTLHVVVPISATLSSFISQKRGLQQKWVKAIARGLDVV